MLCKNCNHEIDPDSNFCKQCGIGQTSKTATFQNDTNDPNYTIFSSLKSDKSNLDVGYLIIAIIVLLNIFLWYFWTLIGGNVGSDYRLTVSILRIISALFLLTEFAVMIFFTKNRNYRITIIIIGLVIAITQFYNIIQFLKFD